MYSVPLPRSQYSTVGLLLLIIAVIALMKKMIAGCTLSGLTQPAFVCTSPRYEMETTVYTRARHASQTPVRCCSRRLECFSTVTSNSVRPS